MKKLLLAAFMMIGIISFSNAQTDSSARKSSTRKSASAKPAADNTRTVPAHTAAPQAVTPASGTVLKKDGTPDKRYKASASQAPLKKDGTPDKRYKANKRPA